MPPSVPISESAVTSSAKAGTTATNRGVYREAAILSREVGGTTYQLIAFWDQNDKLAFAKRDITTDIWTTYVTAITLSADDSHRVISIGIDPDDYIHVCYDMHADALLYRKSTNPIATFDGTLSGVLPMLGTNEGQVTYPTFFNDPSDVLYFIFRDGTAGDGDLYFYEYDEGAGTWSLATGTGAGGKLIDGKGAAPDVNPYWWGAPAFDDDFGSGGYMHLMWCWRDVAENTNHNLLYVKWDGTDFTQSDDGAQAVPITPVNVDVAAVIAQGINYVNNATIDVDSSGQPHAVYTHEDGSSYAQYYHVYFNGSSWVTFTLTSRENSGWIEPRPVLAIDKATDTVYILYTDAATDYKLFVLVSDPGDYTNWTKYLVYEENFGYWEPQFDRWQWRDNQIFYLPIAAWFADGTSFPIDVIRWDTN